MTKRLKRGNLQVSEILATFIESEALNDTNISPDIFWEKLEKMLVPRKYSKNLFFKIDIEGSEYRLLEELVEFQGTMCGLVIEFHDIDLHIEKINNFIKLIFIFIW